MWDPAADTCRTSPALTTACAVLMAWVSGCSPAGQPAGRAGAATVPEAVSSAPDLPDPAPDGGFTDVTLAAGITARHLLPGDDLDNIVDSLGAGAAFLDYDGDGWLDLILTGGPRSPIAGEATPHAGLHLYRNLADGRFIDATLTAGLPPHATAVAVAVGDADGDGHPDIYLVDRGPNRLFLNQRDGTYVEASSTAGVGDARFGVGAVFFDMDGDGDQDIYLTNYLDFDPRQTAHFSPDAFPGPLAYTAQTDVVYSNRGDGTFEDVSQAAGVTGLAGRGMSLAAADFDDDGDTDIFVANDATVNFLLTNDGRGVFTEQGLLAGVAMGENGEQTATMSATVGDVDGDGQADLLVSDTSYGAFYRRIGPGRFRDDVMSSGLARLSGQYVSWGQTLLDFDNDGLLDLFVVNGGMHHLVGWEDSLLRNAGDGRFEDSSFAGGDYFADRQVGRCVISGDYDNDGDLDLFVTVNGGRPFLLRNDLPATSQWLVLDLKLRDGRAPLGADVTVLADGTHYRAEWRSPSTYLGQSDPRLHFGLGPAVDAVEQIEILWPGGRRQVVRDLPAGQVHEIREDS
jgi:hypothetical protein